MTADGLAAEVRAPAGTGERVPPLDLDTIVGLCDQALGEIGRRSHCFAWLRAPDAGAEEWLAVDAYYPANRLVVICRSGSDPHAQLCTELVPAHGLRLLAADLAQLGSDRGEAEAFVRRSLSAIGPPPVGRDLCIARASRCLRLHRPTPAGLPIGSIRAGPGRSE
jgi:hypothetical protein